jgi:hypothetical protein
MGSDAHEGWLPGGAVVPLARAAQALVLDLEIMDDGGGHYLLVYNAQNADVAGDTWHETLDQAFDAAEINFGIARSEWKCK